jgi:hypothetical protein
MSDKQKFGPSFSTASRWRIGFDVILRTALVVAVVVMANYLASTFPQRFYLSSQTRVALSSRTLAVLKSVTNQVDVTLYYNTRPDDSEPNFYPDIAALLDEYHSANRNIVVHTVDYVRDPGLAEMTKAKYRQYFNTQADKDMVIFDNNGRVKAFPGGQLIEYKTEQKAARKNDKAPGGLELEFERRPVNFNGEQAFTSILLALANPQPLKAYFLQGHREASLTSSDNDGYQKFASVLQQNYISVANLDWAGNAGVPMDCNLLIIAGPKDRFNDSELQQISQYLREGGKLLVMFSFASRGNPTGLEGVLQNWGVGVVDDIALDPDHTVSTHDVIVDTFDKHPVVDSLSQQQLQLYSPHPVVKLPQSSQVANTPEVSTLFGTSGSGVLMDNRAEPPQHIPLACAVEQKPVAGVTNPRGNTRIIAIGDYVFWGNYYIDSAANRDFLNSTINWLCDRPFLLNGIGPRPVTNFRLQITPYQQRRLNWLLLGALPGGVLLFGSFVWFARRK